ncbi:hypothetical protein E4U53_007028 [Claviceps sorghi]|nr:hypothetical protein E4U53_007028 [Claviceps sorghi]
MLTAIGRAAARRALLPNRSAAPQLTLTTQLLRGPGSHAGAALLPASARTLIVSARLLSPTKTAAASSSTGSKGKKTTAAATKKKSAATKKKPAAKKKPASKKKTVTKKKKRVVKKKPAKKPKKPKKQLTPEEKEKAELKEIKKLALLKGPVMRPESAWNVFVAENVKPGPAPLGDKMKETSENFSKLSAAEKERLESVAVRNQAINKQSRQDWIHGFPPEAIYAANLARRRLSRKLKKNRTVLVHDDRQPRRGKSPYCLFVKARFAQVNSDSATNQDAFRTMAQQWKSLSESEKQRFRDESAKDVEAARADLQKIREKAKAYVKAHRASSTQARKSSA